MSVSKFPVGFWNYISIKDVSSNHLKDWEEGGFSLLMSPSYSTEDRQNVYEFLDWCQKRSIKVLLQDPRISLGSYMSDYKKGRGEFVLPEEYEDNAIEAIKEFGQHAAVMGFFIIDEPAGDVLNAVIQAVQIVKKHSNKLPFVNFLPYYKNIWERIRFKDYGKYICNYIEQTDVDVICYDYYAQMTERQYEDPNYFTNLKYFMDNSQKLGINFWNTLLSTAHFRYRIPSYDDMRWQVNTSLAYGAKGILYFTFYTPDNTHRNETNYRQGPINWWGERTDVFYHIKDVNRELHQRWGDLFIDMDVTKVVHYPKAPLENLASFSGDGAVSEVDILSGMDPHIIISEFKHITDGHNYIFVVNANPRDSVYVSLGLPGVSGVERFTVSGESYAVKNEIDTVDFFDTRLWLAPGQGELLRLTLA